jgi:hypothetical protein
MRGDRSKDNCYLWKPKDSGHFPKCSLAKGDQEGKLGHGRPDQLHVKGIKKRISKGTMRGVPYLSLDKKTDCGKCLIEGYEPVAPIGHDMTAREKQMGVLLSSAETKYLASGSRWSTPVWRNLMQTEYNVTQNVMTLYVNQFENSKGKEGMYTSDKL